MNVTQNNARGIETHKAIVYNPSNPSSGNQLAMSAPMKEGVNENGICKVKFSVKIPNINPEPTETRWFVNGKQVALNRNSIVQSFR